MPVRCVLPAPCGRDSLSRTRAMKDYVAKNIARVLSLLFCAAASYAADPALPSQEPGNFLARLEALALLQTLNADLLSHDSATLTLERWCDSHRLASPPHIVADRVMGADKKPTPEQRRGL